MFRYFKQAVVMPAQPPSCAEGYSEEAQNVGLQMLGEELAEKVFNQARHCKRFAG